MITYDGCDDAIVGLVVDEGDRKRAVYDYAKLVEVFKAQGMGEEDALEWIDYNILGVYLGRQTPAILFPGDRAMIDTMADEDEPEEET